MWVVMVRVFAGSREEWAGCLIGWLGKASRKKLIGDGALVIIPGLREGCSGYGGPSQTGASCPRGWGVSGLPPEGLCPESGEKPLRGPRKEKLV